MAEWYNEVLGQVAGLRRGLTSGTCAQAAAAAALRYLLCGEKSDSVTVTLPRSKEEYSMKRIRIPVESLEKEEQHAVATVRKDAGDDKDLTHGLLVGADVCLLPDEPGVVRIDGGVGVGRIPAGSVLGEAGAPAINPVPRKMITEELRRLLPAGAGCLVKIFVPRGEEVADTTWNPRLGIRGGISIIGTRGVVEPRSDNAYKASIRAVIRNFAAGGIRHFIITPGFVGEKYLRGKGVEVNRVVTAGDHIGHALRLACRYGARRITLVGHIGKLTKIAAGIFNTHYSSGDARLEVIAAWAAAAGASRDVVIRILSLELAEEAIGILEANHLEAVFSLICERVVLRMNRFLKGQCPVGCVLLSLAGERLGSLPEKNEFDFFLKGEGI